MFCVLPLPLLSLLTPRCGFLLLLVLSHSREVALGGGWFAWEGDIGRQQGWEMLFMCDGAYFPACSVSSGVCCVTHANRQSVNCIFADLGSQ